mmetsp:Transcript_45379/g.117444  ORF Transcript_45379/g.117444 Transcript_45379/m.117444 type:complete len:160 (-) Transcript_45379:137-616(-)
MPSRSDAEVTPPKGQSGAMSPTSGRTAAVTSGQKADADKAPSVDDPEDHENMATLLDRLTTQKADLYKQQDKEDAQRAAAARRAASARRGGFVPSAPWRRACAEARVFEKEIHLGTKYLSPFEQQAAARPARTYDQRTSPPFLDGDSVPKLFGPPPLGH